MVLFNNDLNEDYTQAPIYILYVELNLYYFLFWILYSILQDQVDCSCKSEVRDIFIKLKFNPSKIKTNLWCIKINFLHRREHNVLLSERPID